MTDTTAPYAPGDLVLVVDGVFASLEGVVRDVDVSRDELSVEVTILGRPVPIHADYRQVTPR